MATILACVIFFWTWRSGLATGAAQPTWFAGYVDVTVSPPYAFEEASGPGTRDVVLAFLVASPAGLLRGQLGRRLRPRRGRYGPAAWTNGFPCFGPGEGRPRCPLAGPGTVNWPPRARTKAKLRTAYRDVVERYEPSFIDFDLEGADLLDQAGGERRAKAVASLQGDRNASGQRLAVWLTLPASPRGLTDAGIAAVEQMLQAGVQLSGVNIMTMNYGASRSSSQGMLEAAKAAADATHDQLGIVYQRAGVNLSREQVWKKIGLTPMIGRNDLPGEIFELDAARDLKDYAVGLGSSACRCGRSTATLPALPVSRGRTPVLHLQRRGPGHGALLRSPGIRAPWQDGLSRVPLLHLAGGDHVQPGARRNIL